jgi:hypothetical protein
MRALAAIAAFALLAAPAAEARKRKRLVARDPLTAGIGRSCKSNKGCGHARQICLKENDANGKQLARGICVLPCAPLDAGLGKKGEPFPDKVNEGAPPPRCPKRYDCRSAGAGVSIDLCVRK